MVRARRRNGKADATGGALRQRRLAEPGRRTFVLSIVSYVPKRGLRRRPSSSRPVAPYAYGAARTRTARRSFGARATIPCATSADRTQVVERRSQVCCQFFSPCFSTDVRHLFFSGTPRMSTPVIADPQLPSVVHRAPRSHTTSPDIGVGEFSFPEKPVPFHPSIGLYSGTSRFARPLAESQPVLMDQSLNLFLHPRSPSPIIPNTPPSSDGSPVVSDGSSSPEASFYTPALPAAEF